jgi:nicotinamide-nucleotide amidase
MRAAIIAVGTELLGTERLDTNSLRLTGIFRRHGVELARKSVIGDREEELHRELELVLGRYDLVVTSGGLGPTSTRACWRTSRPSSARSGAPCRRSTAARRW